MVQLSVLIDGSAVGAEGKRQETQYLSRTSVPGKDSWETLRKGFLSYVGLLSYGRVLRSLESQTRSATMRYSRPGRNPLSGLEPPQFGHRPVAGFAARTCLGLGGAAAN